MTVFILSTSVPVIKKIIMVILLYLQNPAFHLFLNWWCLGENLDWSRMIFSYSLNVFFVHVFTRQFAMLCLVKLFSVLLKQSVN